MSTRQIHCGFSVQQWFRWIAPPGRCPVRPSRFSKLSCRRQKPWALPRLLATGYGGYRKLIVLGLNDAGHEVFPHLEACHVVRVTAEDDVGTSFRPNVGGDGTPAPRRPAWATISDFSLYVFGFGIQQVVVNAKLTQGGRQHLGFFSTLVVPPHRTGRTGLRACRHIPWPPPSTWPLRFCRPRQTGLSGPGDGWWE